MENVADEAVVPEEIAIENDVNDLAHQKKWVVIKRTEIGAGAILLVRLNRNANTSTGTFHRRVSNT